MRRNSSTVVVLAGQVPGEVLAAATRSLNVTLYQPAAPPAQEGAAKNGTGPEDGDGDSLAAAAAALQRAGRSTSPYALVPAQALAAWRGGQFELPDYYLVLAQQAAGVLSALGSLRHGPWWPGLDQVIETARRFYPASLSGTDSATLAGGPARAG